MNQQDDLRAIARGIIDANRRQVGNPRLGLDVQGHVQQARRYPGTRRTRKRPIAAEGERGLK